MTGEVEVRDKLSRLVHLLELIAREDTYLKILLKLAMLEQEYISLRGLAREVNMAPKNVKRYLQKLSSLGIVKIEQPHEKILLISLSDEYKWLRDVFTRKAS